MSELRPLLLIAGIALTACEGERVSRNFVGRVLAAPYVPATNGSGLGVGFNSKGGTTVMPVFTHTDAVYQVVIEGQYGRAVFSDSALWSHVRIGDSVMVGYLVGTDMTVTGWRLLGRDI